MPQIASEYSEYGCTIAKDRLSRHLYTLRVQARYTCSQIDDWFEWGRTKAHRWENNHWQKPQVDRVKVLLTDLYGIGGDQLEEMLDWARHACVTPWWREFNDDVWEDERLGFEFDATAILYYTPLLIPSLAQTPAYMQALLDSHQREDMWKQRAMKARLTSQRILDRTDHTLPTCVFLIEETALDYAWGSPEDRAEQLTHLVELAQRPNIELRIVRPSRGFHAGMSSLITVYGFPREDLDPPKVWIETDISNKEARKEQERHYLIESFGLIREQAADPDESLGLVKRALSQLE